MDVLNILTAIEQTGLSVWLNTTNGAFAVVESFHVIAIALVFGTILIVDLRLLGVASTRRPFTRVAAETLKWTWAGFALAAVTGSLMFITNPLFYFENLEFRIKMVFLLLAGINMAVFELSTVKTVAAWDSSGSIPISVRTAGLLSLLFWSTVIVYGRLIGFAASAMDDPFAGL